MVNKFTSKLKFMNNIKNNNKIYYPKLLFLSLLSVLILIFLVILKIIYSFKCKESYINLTNLNNSNSNSSNSNTPTLHLKRVSTPEDLKKGLMFRKKPLSLYQGMLFEFPNIGNNSIWMKNTFIPLDVVFLDDSFNIIFLYENTTPHSLRSIGTEKPSKYIIELNKGDIMKYHLKLDQNIKNNINYIDELD